MKRVHRLLACVALYLPAFAQAQLLDFDSVCSAPPCAIGSLYAPSGITFTPSSAQIVAAGTNGLTGTVGGGRYLSIASFPYQITVTLARQATFFAMQLSRASTSSGPVTVAVTWLKLGVPVSSQNVVLTNVNAWSLASASVPGGFDSIFLDPSGGANLTFGIDGIQFGGTCNGFSDVQPTDSFCNASEWLANRGVTLGCAAGQYCPSQNVTRAQMALFMQRLGDALTPQYAQAIEAFSGNFDTSRFLCQTPAFLVTGSPRTAFVHAFGYIFLPSAALTVFTKAAYSTDDGASWTDIPGGGIKISISGASFEGVPASDGGVLDLQVGTSYRFAFRVIRSSGGTPGITAAFECEVIAQIGNRRAAPSAPFDPVPQTHQ